MKKEVMGQRRLDSPARLHECPETTGLLLV